MIENPMFSSTQVQILCQSRVVSCGIVRVQGASSKQHQVAHMALPLAVVSDSHHGAVGLKPHRVKGASGDHWPVFPLKVRSD
jgi:hypothetical protein